MHIVRERACVRCGPMTCVISCIFSWRESLVRYEYRACGAPPRFPRFPFSERSSLSLPFFVSLVMANFRLIFYTDRVMDPRERACELSTDYGICFVRASYGANSRTVAATAAALPSSLRRRRFPVLSFKRKRENATTRWENVSNRRERFAKIRGIKSAQSVE